MQGNRTQNANRNIIFGIIHKLYQIIVPFLFRTVMIYVLGMEYVGLNGLFASVIQVLNITELGVGVAMVYSMYKPIAENDEDTICKLLVLYKSYYRIIGIIIAFFGLIVTPFLPQLVKGDLPNNINFYYIYWLNLGNTVLSYWLFAYKGSLLQAHQRSDVISKITMSVNTVIYFLHIVLIILFKNYYLYLIIMMLGQAVINITTAIVASKMYPNYQPKGKVNKSYAKQINRRIRDLFTAKIGGVIQSSVDSIVISSFLGLTILARYQNYYFILEAIFGFVAILFSSVLAGVGNSIITESPEKNFRDFNTIAFVIEWIAGFCGCCLLCLYQPFMKLWVGEDNIISFGVVVCLVVYFVIIVTNQMLCLYKDGAGIWHEDRYRPLIVASVNLIMNLVTVRYWGLYGVVLSTVLSMLVIGMPWLIYNLFKFVFKRSPKNFLVSLGHYFVVMVIVITFTYYITDRITDTGIISFLIKLMICIIIPNVLFFVFYIKQTQLYEALLIAKRITKGRIIKRIIILLERLIRIRRRNVHKY